MSVYYFWTRSHRVTPPGPGIYYGDQTCLRLRDPPSSASWVLGSEAHTWPFKKCFYLLAATPAVAQMWRSEAIYRSRVHSFQYGGPMSSDLVASTSFPAVSFWQLDTSQSHMGRENLNRRIASIRLSCGQVCEALSWLMIYEGGSSSLWMVLSLSSSPGWYKPMTGSKPVSSPWCPLLPFLLGFPQQWAMNELNAVGWNKPLPPCIVYGHNVHHGGCSSIQGCLCSSGSFLFPWGFYNYCFVSVKNDSGILMGMHWDNSCLVMRLLSQPSFCQTWSLTSFSRCSIILLYRSLT